MACETTENVYTYHPKIHKKIPSGAQKVAYRIWKEWPNTRMSAGLPYGKAYIHECFLYHSKEINALGIDTLEQFKRTIMYSKQKARKARNAYRRLQSRIID